MKLNKFTYKEAKEGEYYYFTGVVSDICRKLSFAGIAIIWIFTISESQNIKMPTILVSALLGFLLSLFSDLIQYVIGTFVWKKIVNDAEIKGQSGDDEIEVNAKIIKFIEYPFYLKIGFVLSGYILIIIFMASILSAS